MRSIGNIQPKEHPIFFKRRDNGYSVCAISKECARVPRVDRLECRVDSAPAPGASRQAACRPPSTAAAALVRRLAGEDSARRLCARSNVACTAA